jgi:hypothetical protein
VTPCRSSPIDSTLSDSGTEGIYNAAHRDWRFDGHRRYWACFMRFTAAAENFFR